jgi:hypothetical protein
VSGVQCMVGTSTNNGDVEEFLEVHSEDSTNHPTMNAPLDGSGVNFVDTRLRADPGTWNLWTASSSSFPTDPYNVCWTHQYYEWRAGRNLNCSDPDDPEV